MNDCGCFFLNDHAVFCRRHWADLSAELEQEPRVIPALIRMLEKCPEDKP